MPSARSPASNQIMTEQTSNEMRLLPEIGEGCFCLLHCLLIFLTQSFNNGTGNRSDLAELIDLCQSLPFGGYSPEWFECDREWKVDPA